MTLSDFELNHPCGVLLSRALTERALLATVPDVVESKRDAHTGWVWYQLPMLREEDYIIRVGLGFNDGSLATIKFADTNPIFGVDWNEWSEEKERLRAKSTERWLQIRGIAVGSYSWGSVWAGYDGKGGHGSATVRLGILDISAPKNRHDSEWLAMRAALWPEVAHAEHLLAMDDALARGHYVRLAGGPSGVALGFVEASKRVDYVNGTESSPVAFLEGIYVMPQFRRQGVARALVAAVVNWARGQGCRELASDSLLPNIDAHAAHTAMGFEETERVVFFRMALPDE